MFWKIFPVLSNKDVILNLLELGDSCNYLAHALVPSSAKRFATQTLVISKLDGRKDLVWDVAFTIWRSQQTSSCPKLVTLKHKNKAWKLFKIKTKTLERRQCSNCWLWTGKRLLGSYWKDEHFLKTRSGISYVML